MQRTQAGFTLIELIMVLIILGILAATGLPQFIDISGSAKTAAVAGVAGALSSANAINYSARKAGAGGIAISNCQTLASVMAGSVLPTGYTITSTALTSEVTSTCSLTYTPTSGSSVTTSFTGTGVS